MHLMYTVVGGDRQSLTGSHSVVVFGLWYYVRVMLLSRHVLKCATLGLVNPKALNLISARTPYPEMLNLPQKRYSPTPKPFNLSPKHGLGGFRGFRVLGV